MFTSLKDSARQSQEAQRKAEREEKDHIEQIKKLVDADFADREKALAFKEKDVAAKVARLNESINFINATLMDAGLVETAKVLVEKIKGKWAEGDR
jgi:hypothetical protein